MIFFLMSQGSFSPKIWFLGQKMCCVAQGQTDMKLKTEDTLSGFQESFKFSFLLSSNSGPIREFSFSKVKFHSFLNNIVLWIFFELICKVFMVAKMSCCKEHQVNVFIKVLNFVTIQS